MGDPLSNLQDEFLQLHLHALPAVCIAESDSVFAVHSDDEGPREAVGARHGLEEGV